MIQRKEFARIFEVFGNRARAYITLEASDTLEIKSGGYERIGVVGHHVIIPTGSTKLVARISSITASDPNFKILNNSNLPSFINFQKILELDFIGSIQTENRKQIFDRGIKSYPVADDPVYSIIDNELKLLFIGEEGRDSISIGNVIESNSEKVYIDTEKLFQSHFGVLGATGSGKTCTLIHLLQSVLNDPSYKSPHFLILDPHGEYAKAFDNTEFGNKTLVLRINNNSDDYKNLKVINTDLPHYFFSFSEYKTLYRPAPQVQEPSLREAIGRVRKKQNSGKFTDKDNTVVADLPIQFNIHELYKDIFEKNKDASGGGFLGSLGYRLKVLAGQPELKFLFDPKNGILEFDSFLKNLLGFDSDNRFYSITIVDLSGIPRILNLLTILTNLLARMIYDSLRSENFRGEKHCCIVLEEAHNYVPRQFNSYDRSDDHDFTLGTFETIAKEGRKYGACLSISSQRPRDLSETLISQCGTFFIHRLSNAHDKEIIKSAASNIETSLLERMPVLTKQSCIVMGDAIKCTAEVDIESLKYPPDSASTKISEVWRKEPVYPGAQAKDVNFDDDIPF